MRGHFFNILIGLVWLLGTASSSLAEVSATSETVKAWCSDAERAISQFKWKIDPCKGIDWKVGGKSVRGRPLVYAEFGDLRAENVTLIFSMVHGDEITPFYVGIQLAQWLKAHAASLGNTRVVIAPLVNPDGFYSQPRTRVNANGVDINRNFNTEDWKVRAISLWKTKYKSDPRRNPGPVARSEPETVFQEEMIGKVNPQKILSIHSPLNFLDYDGPGTITMPHLPSNYIREMRPFKEKFESQLGRVFSWVPG